MLRDRTYKVILEQMPSGLVVVAESTVPSLHLSAPSMEAMLESLPRVIEHLFLDILKQQVSVERVVKRPRRYNYDAFRNRAERRSARKIVIVNDHTQIATLALAS